MAVLSPDILAILACALLTIALLWVRRQGRNLPPLPPGPPGLPIIGNLLDVPDFKGYPWATYRDLCRKHNSDIIRLNTLGMNIIVLNTFEVASDLLDKRSAIYSDRPRMIMLSELCGFGANMAFLPYDSTWKTSRKMARLEFHSNPAKRFRPVEAKSARRFLRALYGQKNSDKLMDSIRYLAGTTIMSIGYDIEVQDKDDPYVRTAEEAIGSIVETTNAGAYLVDVIPWLRYIPEWFPGAKFQRQAKVWNAAIHKVFHNPYDNAKNRMNVGQLGDCAAKAMIEKFSNGPTDPSAEYTNGVIRSTLASLYVGGADTTVSGLGTFFLAMTLNPEVQAKAHKQLDEVVGAHRLPTFNDQAALPYIEAIVRENIRWRPVVPLNVPHRLSEDDVYRGYFLPKGSTIVANNWAVLHDEKMYPDPERYNPDRFLRPDGTLDPAVRDPSVAAFGFGRRICPGRYMALDSMWIAIASVLAVYEIRKAVDADGFEITPDGEYIRGFLCHPKPFPCVIKPRSAEHEQFLNELVNQEN